MKILSSMLAAALLASSVVAQETAQAKPLLDGKTLAGWTDRAGKPVDAATSGWKIETDGSLRRGAKAGDLFSEKEYGDFELSWEWKIAVGGNSGVKYRVTKYGQELLGPEYQMLDDAKHPDGKLATHRAGCIYDLVAAPEAQAKTPGEWNTSRIVASGGKFEHWLNGKLVASCDTASPEWAAAVAKSKFKKKPDWAKNAKGKIMLQDHGDEAWFRNLSIKEL